MGQCPTCKTHLNVCDIVTGMEPYRCPSCGRLCMTAEIQHVKKMEEARREVEAGPYFWKKEQERQFAEMRPSERNQQTVLRNFGKSA